MANYAPTNGSVYVCNLPFGTDETMLAEHFGTIGLLKKDKRTGRPKIWIYRDKVTNEPKGDATVTYEDPHAALAAVEWFNNKDFHGATIGVLMAESKNKDDTVNHGVDQALISDVNDLEEGPRDANGAGGRGRGRGDAGGKPWQQDGDWLCTNTRSVMRLLLWQCKLCISRCVQPLWNCTPCWSFWWRGSRWWPGKGAR